MEEQRRRFRDTIVSDVGLEFGDVDPLSSDSELEDIVNKGG